MGGAWSEEHEAQPSVKLVDLLNRDSRSTWDRESISRSVMIFNNYEYTSAAVNQPDPAPLPQIYCLQAAYLFKPGGHYQFTVRFNELDAKTEVWLGLLPGSSLNGNNNSAMGSGIKVGSASKGVALGQQRHLYNEGVKVVYPVDIRKGAEITCCVKLDHSNSTLLFNPALNHPIDIPCREYRPAVSFIGTGMRVTLVECKMTQAPVAPVRPLCAPPTPHLWRSLRANFSGVTEQINILILGKPGVGKSAFINTLVSAMQGAANAATPLQGPCQRVLYPAPQKPSDAPTSNIHGHTTTKICDYRLNGCKVVLRDVWGPDYKDDYHNILPIIQGHLAVGAQYVPKAIAKAGDPDWIATPDAQDKIHGVIVILGDAKKKDEDIVRLLTKLPKDMNFQMPTIVITKADLIDSRLRDHPDLIPECLGGLDAVAAAKRWTGSDGNQIFVVQSYSDQIYRNLELECAPLEALWKAVSHASGFKDIRQEVRL